MFQATCNNGSYSNVWSRLFSITLINKLTNLLTYLLTYLLTLTDYMEQNPSKQANNVSRSQEIARV